MKMTVVRRAFGLSVACGGRPSAGQIVKTIPMNTRGLADQEFRCAMQAEFLDFLGAERRYTCFGDPDGKMRYTADLAELFGPVVDHPMVPVERKTMHGENVQVLEYALRFHIEHEVGIDRRDCAADARQAGPFRRTRAGRGLGHLRDNCSP